MGVGIRETLERLGYTGAPGELIRARWRNADGYYGLRVTIAIVDTGRGERFLDDSYTLTYFLKFQELTIHALVSESVSLHRSVELRMLQNLRERRKLDGIEFERTSLTVESCAWNEIRGMADEMGILPIAAMMRLA